MDSLSPETQIAVGGDAPAAAGSPPALSPIWSQAARLPGKSNHATRLWTARVLPDPAICRAKAAGFAGYANCLVEAPIQCRYTLSFGFGFFCRHPERDEIVLRTSARAQ